MRQNDITSVFDIQAQAQQQQLENHNFSETSNSLQTSLRLVATFVHKDYTNFNKDWLQQLFNNCKALPILPLNRF